MTGAAQMNPELAGFGSSGPSVVQVICLTVKILQSISLVLLRLNFGSHPLVLS